MKQVQIHEEAIRSHVCTDCIYPSGKGMCGLGHADRCPLNTLLPRAIDAVRQGQSKTILDFLRNLQAGKKNGQVTTMSVEEETWLEDALPLMVEAVEDAELKYARSKKSTRSKN